MRIIGGKYRGKNIFSPQSQGVRPTSDRAREAVFNILFSKLEKSFSQYSLLDVFSGTGAVGLEAISRGFREVGMVDLDTLLLSKNAALFPAEKEKLRIFRQNVLKLGPAVVKYDLLFMDAPYNKGLSEPALLQLATQGWLNPGAMCLVELEKKEKFDIPDGFELLDDRSYGLSRILFLNYQA